MRAVAFRHAAHGLPRRRCTQYGLLFVDREPLLACDRGDQLLKVTAPASELIRPRERQIVGVPRVAHPARRGQPVRPAVEAERGQVGQRRRGRGALRQVRRRELAPEPEPRLHEARLGGARHVVPHRVGDRVRGQAGEDVGDVWSVAEGVKDAEHPAGADRREEVLEVEPQDDWLGCVQAGMGRDRTATSKALRSVVGGDVIEDLMQDPPLDLLQPGFRGLEDSG
jgi:hypothetical protein